jgi:hypothetical protein
MICMLMFIFFVQTGNYTLIDLSGRLEYNSLFVGLRGWGAGANHRNIYRLGSG